MAEIMNGWPGLFLDLWRLMGKSRSFRRVFLALQISCALLLLAPALRAEPRARPTYTTLPRPGSRAAAIYDSRVRFKHPRLGGTFSRRGSFAIL